MEHRLELAAKALAIERVASGALAAMVPSRAIRAIATPKSDTEAARYVARLLGIRQVVLGVMLLQARDDRVWLRRMATLNALMEALDAAATLLALCNGAAAIVPPRRPSARCSRRPLRSSPSALRRPEFVS